MTAATLTVTVSLEERVQELLECNNRLLEEGRAARRQCEMWRFEAELLRREAFEKAEALRAKGPTLREQVLEFHRVFEHPTADKPTIPAEQRVRFRLRLIAEEFFELVKATVRGSNDGLFDAIGDAEDALQWAIDQGPVNVDLVELADAMADLDYVVEGTRLEYGIDGRPVAAEVHRSNMAKLGPDGRPIKRADGKTVKPPSWTPPDIEGVLRAQGWEGPR